MLMHCCKVSGVDPQALQSTLRQDLDGFWPEVPPTPVYLLSIVLHVAISGDELLRSFWEAEENSSNLSPEECAVVKHFKEIHTCARDEFYCAIA